MYRTNRSHAHFSPGSHRPQNQRTAAGFGAPADTGCDVRVAHLAASALAIVAVFALRPSGAGVVGAMAQLAHVFRHQVDAVRVAL